MQDARVVISVSSTCNHGKSDNTGKFPKIRGDLHAEWLEECVRHLATIGYPIVVSLTSFPGICEVPQGREREALWRTSRMAGFITTCVDYPHQKGAAFAIYQSLEFADRHRYDIMVHTAEDVIPNDGAVKRMVSYIEEGWDYAGEVWGENDEQLDSRFFACRVAALVHRFHPDALQNVGGSALEAYMAKLLAMNRVLRMPRGTKDSYFHSHDYAAWCRYLKGMQ